MKICFCYHVIPVTRRQIGKTRVFTFSPICQIALMREQKSVLTIFAELHFLSVFQSAIKLGFCQILNMAYPFFAKIVKNRYLLLEDINISKYRILMFFLVSIHKNGERSCFLRAKDSWVLFIASVCWFDIDWDNLYWKMTKTSLVWIQKSFNLREFTPTFSGQKNSEINSGFTKPTAEITYDQVSQTSENPYYTSFLVNKHARALEKQPVRQFAHPP